MVFFAALTAVANAQTPYDSDIDELMRLTNTVNITDRTVEAMKPNLERQVVQAFPKMPDDARDIFVDAMAEKFLQERDALRTVVADIFKRHFSHDDVKAALAFFRSPAGQTFAQALPKASQESKAAARKWTRQIGPLAGQAGLTRLEELGYDVQSFR
jgi:hypothetical protein